jgi:CDP-diacylglycerol--glycerol-3-phosphate 3-phosphatidyltransferase/cardiolipin synthase
VNTANKISVFRILLVPVFVGFGVYYGDSVASGAPDVRFRYAATFVFALAALSDALDGYIARRYDQKTRLGAILDPLADKLLMVAAILTLSFTSWPQRFPLWFPLIVISKDVLSVAGAFLVDHIAGHCRIKAHWTGKVSTVCQIVALLWVMLDIRLLPAMWSAAVAAFFSVLSGGINLADGIRQLQSSGHTSQDA